MKAKVLLIAAVAATFVAVAAAAGEDALPQGLKGFRGMFRGTIVSKGEKDFVLKVEKVMNVWKGSTASEPQSAVGKELSITISAESRMAENFVKTLAELKPGDAVVVEAFNFEGDKLVVVETLRKAEAAAETPGPEEVARLKARIAELEKTVAALRAENEALRKQLAAAKAGAANY